jgi:uncharacterized protein YjbI with pentapeptide repeats
MESTSEKDRTALAEAEGHSNLGGSADATREPIASKDLQAASSDVFETSRAASQSYFVYLSFLAYCVLSIVTTSDKTVVTNGPIELPIIKKDLSAGLFFFLAPVILIGLFTYFEFFHCRLKDLRSKLDAEVEDHLYPGLLAFEARSETGFVGIIQWIVVQFSLWWLLPVALSLFAFSTMRSHNVPSTIASVSLNIVGTSLVVAFWRKREPATHLGRLVLFWAVILYSCGLLYTIWSITGSRAPSGGLADSWLPSGDLPNACKKTGDVQGWLHSIVLSWVMLDIHGQDLSTSGNLLSVHLEGARMQETIFDKVKLSGASMVGADISGAHFDSAFLDHAQMQSVVLIDSRFENANLEQAQLSGSDLSRADFKNGKMSLVDLRRTCATLANFNSAELVLADFSGADLFSAKLLSVLGAGAKFPGAFAPASEFTDASLPHSIFKQANLLGAKFERVNLTGADLSAANLSAANLSAADLSAANLSDANLSGADLSGANLSDANLSGADLSRADLGNAQNLTIESLRSACTLFQAHLDGPLQENLRPHSPLLMEPLLMKPYRNHDGKCVKHAAK